MLNRASLFTLVLTSAVINAGAQQTPATTITAPELTAPATSLTAAQISSLQHQLADWPQLERYRADNSTLATPAPGERRVIFLGDSITDNWGRLHGKFFPDKPWINRGIGGQTTMQILDRFQQDVLQLHPALVVLLGGINDIAGNTGPETLPEIEANIRSMVLLAQATHVRIVLSSVLPAAAIPWRPGVDPRPRVAALNTWLAQYAATQHLVYLNYYPAMASPDGSMRPGLSSDGVHPIDAGYAVMEPLARAAVARALAHPQP